ncbi:MAG: hypothetical protein Q9159_001888 [Coniocarpon cinnabarinum]
MNAEMKKLGGFDSKLRSDVPRDDFDDDDLNDSDLMAAAQQKDVIADIDDIFPAPAVTEQRMEWKPEKLPNGKWKCSHSCKNDCKHACCKTGMKRPPRGPPKVHSDEEDEYEQSSIFKTFFKRNKREDQVAKEVPVSRPAPKAERRPLFVTESSSPQKIPSHDEHDEMDEPAAKKQKLDVIEKENKPMEEDEEDQAIAWALEEFGDYIEIV